MQRINHDPVMLNDIEANERLARGGGGEHKVWLDAS